MPCRGPESSHCTLKPCTVKQNGSIWEALEQAAGVEVVVLGQRVGEPVADHQDHAALVAEQAADPEADQHDQHRQVEQQVAGLAQLPALGGHPPPSPRSSPSLVEPVAGRALRGRACRDPVPPRERRGRAPQHDLGLLVGGVRRVVRQPGQVARGRGRVGPVAAPVDEQPRHDAADQRHHQQQVDRREPRRVVDREQPEPVVDRRQVGVGGLPVLGLEGVDAALGDHRPRDRAEGQQEQQHEGRPHRGQLAPGPAHELPRRSARRPCGGGRGRRSGCQVPVSSEPPRSAPAGIAARRARPRSLTGSPSSSRPGGSAASSPRCPTSR